MTIHPIPPGLYCVPSALVAITGKDPVSVVTPAINRHSGSVSLLDTVGPAYMQAAVDTLKELGYRVRPYKEPASSGPLRAHVATWAKRTADLWPGRTVFVATRTHALVIQDGVVYDTWQPKGCAGRDHPFARSTVTWAALVEPA